MAIKQPLEAWDTGSIDEPRWLHPRSAEGCERAVVQGDLIAVPDYELDGKLVSDLFETRPGCFPCGRANLT